MASAAGRLLSLAFEPLRPQNLESFPNERRGTAMSEKKSVIAQRVANLDASGIRKVFDLGATMKDPVDLSIGQPDFDVPEPIKEAAIEAIRKGQNKYTQTQGIADLREAIAADLCREFGWKEAPPVLVTSGVSGALLLLTFSVVDPGDEVIILDPFFMMYLHQVRLAGGVPVLVDTYPDFRPPLDRIEAAITPRTKLLIINSPCNPSGAIYTREELQSIAEIARRHDLLVVSDEIYNFFCYDAPFVSFAEFYENTILMRGFSKSYAMTGWRLAYVTGPKPVIEKMTTLQQYSFVCAPSMAQAAGVVALRTDMSAQVAAYKRKRDMVYEALHDSFGLLKPAGAFYAFVPAPKGMTATDFVTKAIQNNVLIIPGNVFSQRDTHFRLSYATTDEKLARGLEILNRLAASI
jgi:aspartate aminotransferase/aminotransferase